MTQADGSSGSGRGAATTSAAAPPVPIVAAAEHSRTSSCKAAPASTWMRCTSGESLVSHRSRMLSAASRPCSCTAGAGRGLGCGLRAYHTHSAQRSLHGACAMLTARVCSASCRLPSYAHALATHCHPGRSSCKSAAGRRMRRQHSSRSRAFTHLANARDGPQVDAAHAGKEGVAAQLQWDAGEGPQPGC